MWYQKNYVDSYNNFNLGGVKKIFDFSMVESKSLDDSTAGVTYLSLSMVESESLDLSIEKCDI